MVIGIVQDIPDTDYLVERSLLLSKMQVKTKFLLCSLFQLNRNG